MLFSQYVSVKISEFSGTFVLKPNQKIQLWKRFLLKSITFYLSLDYFFLSLNSQTTTRTTDISHAISVEESNYSSKLEIYLFCNSYRKKTLFPAALEGTIQMVHIWKAAFVQKL